MSNDTNKLDNVYPNIEQQHCYECGYDAKLNGENKINSSYDLFSTPEKTKAWEHGSMIADLKKGSKNVK